MTRLQLTLSGPRLAGGGEDYLPLQADETLASWARRQPGVLMHSDSPSENTFGRLDINLPGISHTLRRELHRAAKAPDDWLLQPYQRTLSCPLCMAEDWAQGVPSYIRRSWCVAWRTCCSRHGVLFDSYKRPSPAWYRLLVGPRWSGGELRIILRSPAWSPVKFSLGSDHRAVHLEAALAGRRPGFWFPKGMNQASLRTIYREIISDLLDQVFLAYDGPEDQLPHPSFNHQNNDNRFAINVLAEAILSEWTNTPLPTSAMAQRTSLLVRAIGWGERKPPFVRAGQVLFRGPIERTPSLMRYEKYLTSKHFVRLSRPTDGNRTGYLTLPEARLLGLDCSEAVTSLKRMVGRGQFLAFNARRGSLVENPHLPSQARLVPPSHPEEMILPGWAFRDLPPREHTNDNGWLRDLLALELSPDTKLRQIATRRRQREERTWVRFCPEARGGDT